MNHGDILCRHRKPPGLALALLLASLAHPANAADFGLTNLMAVNVTASGFSVVFQAADRVQSSLVVFADAAGQTNLAGTLGMETLPMHTGDPSAPDAYTRRQRLALTRQKTLAAGLGHVRVSECAPATTYYYQVIARGTGGTEQRYPDTAPFPSVTTATATAFVQHARQLLIEVGGADPEGQILTLTTTNAVYPIAAVIGDGAATNQAYFNVSDLIALTGGLNYLPVGDERFEVTLHAPGAEALSQPYVLSFDTSFLVAAAESLGFGREFTALTLGSGSVTAGTSGSIPITVNTGIELREIAWQLHVPSNTLSQVRFDNLHASVQVASVLPTSNPDVLQLNITAIPGQPFSGQLALARLTFSVAPAAPSGILTLQPANLVARKPDGSTVPNLAATSSQLVIVNETPILLASRTADGRPLLALYGRPGASYQIQFAAALTPSTLWQNWTRVGLTSSAWSTTSLPTPSPGAFFRAYQFVADPPILDAALTTNQRGSLTIFGQPGARYQVQSATNVTPPVTWRPHLTYTLTNSFHVVTNIDFSQPIVIFRLQGPLP